MMTNVLGLIIGLLSTTTAFQIYSGVGNRVNICNGIVCPPNTGCHVVSSSYNAFHISRDRCVDFNGSTVKERMIAEVYKGAGYFLFNAGNIVMCMITSDTINTTKVCQDDKGNLKQMTPEEEAILAEQPEAREKAGILSQQLLEDMEKVLDEEEERRQQLMEDLEEMLDKEEESSQQLMEDIENQFDNLDDWL
ncbi:uncharacterized protein [Anabrus simplex]|uniref:uncharacterized protein isoform X1 n=1 Tax=Anabrus simplex TaxID=316456 RepID=UPI0035A3441D